MDCNPPGSSVPGIVQARILKWVAISSSWDLPDSGIKPASYSEASPVYPALQADSLSLSLWLWEILPFLFKGALFPLVMCFLPPSCLG